MKISIIIPAYNEEKIIGNRLAGLQSGLTLPHEIIVSDDKSTDDTVAIAGHYADKVLVPETKHASPAATRNDGARAAQGDLFVFLDADSLIKEPEAFFTRAIARFVEDEKLAGVTGPVKVDPETETIPDKIVYFLINIISRIKNNVFHIGEVQGKFMMARASAFKKIGGFRDDLITSEDVDLFARLSKVGETLFDPKLVVYHSGRRAHAIGWIRLLSIWARERFWFGFFGKSFKKDWTRWWEPKDVSSNQ